MARGNGEPPRKRFARSGHTTHRPATPGPVPAAPLTPSPQGGPTTPFAPPPPGYLPSAAAAARRDLPPPTGPPIWQPPAPAEPARVDLAKSDPFGTPTYHHIHQAPPGYPDGLPTDALPVLPPAGYRASVPSDPDRTGVIPGSGQPTGPLTPPAPTTAPLPIAALPAAAAAKVTVTRVVLSRSNQFARGVTRKVISASEADGARESGLTALIWNQVLSYGTDAMITVALAGTVFFGASTHAQRGNVLLYLLVTMAPFALVAPVIGPALDRLQHGRRWAMGGTGIGRALLALVMASHPTDLFVLYPCALGSLVLSKAYSVIRGAAAPRLVPEGMTLVEANARLSIFGLAAALIGGGVVGGIIKVTGSYTAGLIVTAVAFAACAFFAFRLPKQIDSSAPAKRHREEPSRPRVQRKVPPLARIIAWAQRGFAPQVVTALQGESALRFLSGFLTIFLAFYIETTAHGFSAAGQLGGVAVGAGLGNFVGTGIGARIKLAHPEVIIMISAAVATVTTLVAALLFNITLAIVAMFFSAVANSLAKVALDAVIQRDVAETLRSSAFGRSETFLQLAWVVGAAIACLLPSDNGDLGLWIAGGCMVVATVVVFLRSRAMKRTPSASHYPPAGTVAPHSAQ